MTGFIIIYHTKMAVTVQLMVFKTAIHASCISDENKNKIVMNKDGITIDSSKDVIIKAKGNIQIEGVQNTIKASGIMELKGSMIKLN